MSDLIKYDAAIEPIDSAKHLAEKMELENIINYDSLLNTLIKAAKESKQPPEVRKFYMIHSLYMRRKAGFDLEDYTKPGRPDKSSDYLTVNNLGMNREEARCWRLLSKLDTETFDHLVRSASILTYNLFYNEAKKLNNPDMPTDLYNVIVIDPPWDVKKIERQVAPNQEVDIDYPILSIDEIKALELPAKEDVQVFLWTTHKYLPASFQILQAWDLKYVCTFTWHKPGGMQPYHLPQYNSEFVLYGKKGSIQFVDTKGLKTCFSAPRGGHSEKPDEFFEMIRKATTGQRISMFERRKRNGFDSWGNES